MMGWVRWLTVGLFAGLLPACNQVLGNSNHGLIEDGGSNSTMTDATGDGASGDGSAKRPDGSSSLDGGGGPDGAPRADGAADAGPPCTPQDRRCSPTAAVVQQCDLEGIWRDTQTCPFACSGTGATTACSGTCTPGTMSCGPNNTPVLCDAAGNGQAQTPCTNLCADGACTGECAPNTTRCAPGSTTMVETCDATGHWGAATACTFVCDPSTNNCGGQCSPGSPNTCSGNTVESCDPTGHLQAVMTCTTAPCSNGVCQACTANQKQCNASIPQTCNASGVWVNDQATACPFVCDATSGLCAGACVPGTSACSTTTPSASMTCGANGQYGAPTACPDVCDPSTGKCGGVCVPGSNRCNGSSSDLCGANGQWGPDQSCPFGCNATTGQCNACTDEPMATTCAGGKCGPTLNNCNKTVQCAATCSGTGQSCGGGGVAGVCGCKPEPTTTTCESGMLCGSVTNNCGQSVSCTSTCTAPQTCGGGTNPNTCGCTPKTMAAACGSMNCDSVSDGCGGMISCGSCTAPQTCGGGGTAGVCGCTPMSATAACGSHNCGTASNGCGGMVNCGPLAGACPTGMACASGICASTCTPLTACPTGKNCDTIDNGCGTGTLTCGTMSGKCPSGQTCGGGNPGTANVCGCTPLSATAACGTQNCGTASNGCGGTVTCGTMGGNCPSGQTCGGGNPGTTNVCGCTPLTKTAACGSKNCSSVSDGCGGMISCGTCTAPQTCGGHGQAGVCGCTPLTSCPAGQICGTAPDGCGGQVTCGMCALTVTAGKLTATAGLPVLGQFAVFTDQLTTETASTLTANMAWGDGASSFGTISGQSGSFTIASSHTYASPGSATLTITVTSATSNLVGTATVAVTIRPAPTIMEFPLPTSFSCPEQITAGPDGNLWFTEECASNIGISTPAGSIQERPIGASTTPAGIVSALGNVWFTEEGGTGGIGFMTPTQGLMVFPVTALNGFIPESSIVLGSDGNLWFPASVGSIEPTGALAQITPSGTATPFPMPAGSTGVPLFVAAGSDNRIWFTENQGKIGASTTKGAITEFTLPVGSSVSGITAGPDSALWFVDTGLSKIGRITTSGGITEFTAPLAAQIVTGPDGNLWFTEGSKVGRMTTSGAYTEFSIPLGPAAAFGFTSESVTAITKGPDGNLWFTDGNGSAVGFITP